MTLRTIPAILCLLWVTPVSAQRVHGTVMDGAASVPVDGAMVTLTEEGGKVVTQTLSDTLGQYSILIPESGAYRVSADLYGYLRLESPLASLSVDRSTLIDFELPADPIELDELRVSVERHEELVSRAAMYGVRATELGERFVTYEEIRKRETARDFGQVLQWQSIPGMTIQRGDDVGGRPFVCVRIRRGAANCALTVLDGQIVDSELLGMYPPEALGGILVLSPMEATLSFGTAGGDGAILLFSRAGLARPPG